ncbi:protein kinase C theta type-like [Bufo bufo]|uniref:protein kinase C theta type-like n=1 Tax=Bufo bufo TaxID=8384 RepID=UPI001ABEAB9B|nr:protein kinase C theta type-like [Bufo bufo]
MASTGHREDGEEREDKKRKTEKNSKNSKEMKRKKREKKREDEKRKREEDNESGSKEMKRKKREKKREDEKRKREEDNESGSKEMKKRRGEKARVLEDEEPRAGSSQDPGAPSPYPKLNITRFTIHQVLGRGGFGVVVLASVPRRNTYTAIKIINKRGDNAAILMRERRILLVARDCPFLCHLYAAHQTQERAYFVTEYLSGGSLEDLIDLCGYLNINNVRFYTAEIVCGLQFLHGHNIVHRDIKPDNIMLDKDGHIRIIDLGLAQDGVTFSSKTSGVTGTDVYMAPEVIAGLEYYTAVDWWSLGIVVSRMSSGCSPFYYGSISEEVCKSITTAKADIPSWLDADVQHLLKKLLRKNPERRLGVYKNIRDHPFFNTIVWEDLEERRAQPPCVPFRAALENQHLLWPEDTTPLHPVAGFSYMSPSLARMVKRSKL